MPERGPLSHIDLTVTDPARSILFYGKFFEALGYRRFRSDNPEFAGPNPQRAGWFIKYPTGAYFGIEVRPARTESRHKTHDRYAPGLHYGFCGSRVQLSQGAPRIGRPPARPETKATERLHSAGH